MRQHLRQAPVRHRAFIEIGADQHHAARFLQAGNNNVRPSAHETVGIIEDLIVNEGCDLDLDILPVVQEMLRHPDQGPIKTWGVPWLMEAIREKRDVRRSAAEPPAGALPSRAYAACCSGAAAVMMTAHSTLRTESAKYDSLSNKPLSCRHQRASLNFFILQRAFGASAFGTLGWPTRLTRSGDRQANAPVAGDLHNAYRRRCRRKEPQ
jgi:hypothetical protein